MDKSANKIYDISEFVIDVYESDYDVENNKDIKNRKRISLIFNSETFSKNLECKIKEGKRIVYKNKIYKVISIKDDIVYKNKKRSVMVIDNDILILETCIVNVCEETEDFMDAKRVGADLKEITQKIHRDDVLKYISKLINVKDDNGKIKNSYTILNELGNIFNKLDKYQQKALCKEIGGERHCNMVKNLILNIH